MDKGQTFPEFAMLCARNFGALIMMRDEPMDSPIPTRFKPSDFYITKLKDCQSKLKRLREMTPDKAEDFGREEKSKSIASYERLIAEELEQNARLEKMENAVKAWEPPTPEHLGLKQFMLQQIDVSRHDTAYFRGELSKERAKTPLAFYDAAVRELEREIEYAKKEHAEEVQRTNERNNWVSLLRRSLNGHK